MDIKKHIISHIKLDADFDFESLIVETQDKEKGDYSIPCFSLSKVLHKSPVDIANDIKNNYEQDELVDKIEVVNGYLNFYLNKQKFNELVIKDCQKDDYYTSNEFCGKTLCIDYSSVNLAKYMHIGHLSTTMIGESLARIYEKNGWKVVRINYVGDYGTPFGKMMYAHLNWGNDKDLEEKGVDYLQDMYVKFCALAETDEKLEEEARKYFKLIEDKDEKIYPIYRKFIDVSIDETRKLTEMLGVKFDSWKGEASYSNMLDDVVKELEQKNLLVESQGAKIVNLEDYNLGVCLIQRSDGASLYATRDIAAAKDRFSEYHFDKMFYVTAVQQKLHFEQFFKVLDLMGYDFAKNLEHIYYGMFSLPNGKIASRKGRQAVLKDLFDYALNKVNDIIKDREFAIENKQDVAKKIAMSALKFSVLKNEKIKDAVFDIENCFSFDGDTSAYMQYSYARISSILRKIDNIDYQNIDYSYLDSADCFNLLFAISNYKQVLTKAMEQNEPSMLSKYTLEICKLVNKFYMSEKVISDDKAKTNAKAVLLAVVKNTLKNLFELVCLDTIEEM